MTRPAHGRGQPVSEYPYAGEDDQYEYYIIHDGIGVSHIMRRKKGVHPTIKCEDCD